MHQLRGCIADLPRSVTGDKQFWITRPYRRPALIASKILFLVILVDVPLFLSDCYILGAQGFTVLGAMPALVVRQMLLFALFVLPSFAIATLCSGLSQFLLSWFILLFALICETVLLSVMVGGNAGIDVRAGTNFVVVLLITYCAIVIWQYARRGTNVARLILVIVVCTFMPGSGALSRWQLPRPTPARVERSDIRVTFDRYRETTFRGVVTSPLQGFVSASIPIKVEGMAPMTLLRGSARLQVEAGGRPWPQPDGFVGGSIERMNDEYSLRVDLPESKRDVLNQVSTNLRATFDLEVVTDRVVQKVALTQRSFIVGGGVHCRVFQETPEPQLYCRSGLVDEGETAIYLGHSERLGGPGFTVLKDSIPWGLSPTTDLVTSSFSTNAEGTEFEIVPRRRLANFQQTLDLHDVQMKKYLLPR